MTQQLFLLLSIGRDRYALPASDVIVVLPLAACKQMPGAPDWVAGLFPYGRRHVPVIDLSMLALGRAAMARVSTRLVLVRYAPAGKRPQLLGLIVEQATETLRCDPRQFLASGIVNEQARYLGPVMRHGDGLLQWVSVEALLDETPRVLLYPEDAAAATGEERR